MSEPRSSSRTSPDPSRPTAPPAAAEDALAAAFATIRTGGADETRFALIRAGIELFGRRGFDGTSTREIAKAAGVNIAGIAYHFGGKAGLHRACGEALADILVASVGAIELPEGGVDTLGPEAAGDLFVAALTGMARFMLGRREAESIARFMVREQMDPSETFAVLYQRLILPRHETMCRLFARATGEVATSEAVIVAVSAMFGQIMFFRVGRATALARLDWDVIDAPRLDVILTVVTAAVRATIADRRAAASKETKP